MILVNKERFFIIKFIVFVLGDTTDPPNPLLWIWDYVYNVYPFNTYKSHDIYLGQVWVWIWMTVLRRYEIKLVKLSIDWLYVYVENTNLIFSVM